MSLLRSLLLTLALIAASAAQCIDARSEVITFRIAAWNMESDESSDNLLKQQIGDKVGIDLWGFSEVRDRPAAEAFSEGAGIGESSSDYRLILGEGGRRDRLAIVYNASRLELLESQELNDRLFERHRPPLVARFREVRTRTEFKFIVNHLARGDADARLRQAQFLNQWARTERLPVIAVGDFNFDYHVNLGDGGDRDAGFDALVRDRRWIWVRPEKLVKTQADDRYVSVLDFVFVANPLKGFSATSTILERDGDQTAVTLDFDDDNDQTDHRPVDAVFSVNTTPRSSDLLVANDSDEAPPLSAEGGAILRRIQELETQLKDLKRLIER